MHTGKTSFLPANRGGPAAGHPSLAVALLLLTGFSSIWAPLPASGQQKSDVRSSAGQSSSTQAEARTARALERARQQGSPALRAFFHSMPKGADLHNHLTGAVYAETWIREAAESNLCVNEKTLALYRTAAMTRSLPPQPVCGEQGVPAASALADQDLYNRLIDAFSMRTFVSTTADSGHDHFFSTFGRFEAVSPAYLGDWLDEVAARAATQNEQYLELMQTPDLRPFASIAGGLGPIGSQTDFAQLREQVLDQGLRSQLNGIRAFYDEGERRRWSLEHCGQPQAAPACGVEVRYLYQVLRALSPQMVFVQLVAGFELASADPGIVGINMVQPEDNRVALADYRLHMKMIHDLHALYPKVHITLHAGELAPDLVEPSDLSFHIRSAVEETSAERIGHGVDIMEEDDPYGLLKEMAARRVMVEINLTSNAVILNVKGSDHPFPIYREYHVPVALSTDDEGVSRIDLTEEYVRAALTYPLRYADFKQMVRTSLEHSFLPGESLWEQPGPFETYDHPRAVCRLLIGRAQAASGACATWLESSEKARQQFELERRFHVFESKF
jgi:adenosine deaminase